MPLDPPDDICGFTLQPEDIGGNNGEFVDASEWYELGEITCCWRETWQDQDRCIWHARKEAKPSDELNASRTGKPECLDGAYLEETHLENCSLLAKCRLRMANLSGIEFWEADFSGGDLRGANLSGADLRGADLSNTYLADADFTGTNLRSSDFSGARIILQRRWILPKMREIFQHEIHPRMNPWNIYPPMRLTPMRRRDSAGFSYLSNKNADFSGADLRNTRRLGIALGTADLSKSDILSEANLRNADLSNTGFRNVDLSGIDMRGADLSETSFQAVNFSEADLRDVDLTDTHLQQAVFNEADLRGTDLSVANLENPQLSKAFLRDADISGIWSERKTV